MEGFRGRKKFRLDVFPPSLDQNCLQKTLSCLRYLRPCDCSSTVTHHASSRTDASRTGSSSEFKIHTHYYQHSLLILQNRPSSKFQYVVDANVKHLMLRCQSFEAMSSRKSSFPKTRIEDSYRRQFYGDLIISATTNY